MTKYRRLLASATAALSATALASCSGSHGTTPAAPRHTRTSTTTSTSASRSATPAPSPTHAKPKPRAINPLTGWRPSKNPVVAVRIDDTAGGRPQAGVAYANIVYITQVEGGLTRLLAIFNSRLPARVEPVRSTRADNPQLALEYGRIDYVASGGSRPELVPLYRSHLRRDINDAGGPGFRRDLHRAAPENLIANIAYIAKKLKGPKAKSIGLTWSTHLPAKGTRSGRAVHTMVGGTPVTFLWNAKTHRYVRVIDGQVQRTANGTVISTPNVVVQFCHISVFWKDKDADHNPAAWTRTVGAGKVVVFRNGRQIAGTWTRHGLKDGTVLRDSKGRQIPLAPGGAWFVLAKNGTPLN
jgi:hypothetical protein